MKVERTGRQRIPASAAAVVFGAVVALAAMGWAQPTEDDPTTQKPSSPSAPAAMTSPATTEPAKPPTTQAARRSSDGVGLPEVTAEPLAGHFDLVGDAIGTLPERINGHVYNTAKSKAAIRDFNIEPADVSEEWFIRKYRGAPICGLELTGGRVTGIRLYFAHYDEKKYFEAVSTYRDLRKQGLAVEAWPWPRRDKSAEVEPLVSDAQALEPGAHNVWVRIASRNPKNDPHVAEVLEAILKHQIIRGMTIKEATEAAGDEGSVHYHNGRILWIDWTLRAPGVVRVRKNESTLEGAQVTGMIRVHFENDIVVRVLEIKEGDAKDE